MNQDELLRVVDRAVQATVAMVMCLNLLSGRFFSVSRWVGVLYT